MFLGPILLDEMCESYRQSEILDQEERDMQNIGSTLSVQIYIPSTGNDWQLILSRKYNCPLYYRIIFALLHSHSY